MLDRLISWFATRHLLTNLLFIAVLLGGIASWQQIKKEELPDVTFDFVRVTANYPGATAEEVEHFVTRELEEVLQVVDGVYRIRSTVSRGTTSVSIELEKDYPNKDEAITEIRNAVLDADLPPQVRDRPSVRVYKTSKKAIIDIALINPEVHLLDAGQRRELQRFAAALEAQLVNLPAIHNVNRKGYFQQEIQVLVDPEKLVRYKIPLSQVIREVRDNHVRQPAGHIEARDEPNVVLNAQLNTVEKLNRLYVQAGFEGQAVALRDIAEVREDFRRDIQITKVNGHEAVLFSVVKNGSWGILDALEKVEKVVSSFRENNLKNSSIQVILLDDESLDVRNRLSIIATNGAIGFALILFTLFIFLNKRSGFWVAMGIPFTVAFTLIASVFLGYTVNNTTLAAVIIVMGIVVDDAIVVAENIARFRASGLKEMDAAIKGTSQVFLPVLASITTTCVAFVPLFFFEGRFGHLNSFIPPIVFLMLGASLIESLIILPGHMHFKVRGFLRGRKKDLSQDLGAQRDHWFNRIESRYGDFLIRALPWRYAILGAFVLLLLASAWIASSQMKFVMFPRAETREIVFSGQATENANRWDTAAITRKMEDRLEPFIGKEIIGIRTEIARSRRGGAALENRFRMVIEIVPKEEREQSADELVKLYRSAIGEVEGLDKLTVRKSRWGQSEGSPVEVVVQENDDKLRSTASELLLESMQDHPALANADIDRPTRLPEYKIDIKREKIKRLAISPVDIATTFRASLEGEVLYELPNGNERIDVRLAIKPDAKRDMESILDIPVENRSNYLAPLRDLVEIQRTRSPSSIVRRDGWRTTTVYADLEPDSDMTPEDIAQSLEQGVFREISSKQPSTVLSFIGEIADTRESRGDLRNAVVMVIALIFVILSVLFGSLTRSVLIMLAIPFGVVGVVLAFWAHGMQAFGFFAAIGALGMIGVVINDSIIMITKLDLEYGKAGKIATHNEIARIAQTRLKAVVLTTITTVAGVVPTAYGLAGFDALLSEMMLAMAWGLLFGSLITLLLVPCMYGMIQDLRRWQHEMAS